MASKIEALKVELEELAAELDELEAIERSLDPAQDSEASGDGELSAGDHERMAEIRERLTKLRDFEAETPDWSELIHEGDFEDYAQSTAEDVNGLDLSQWPLTCIDWAHAADELRHDFSCFEFDGETYYAHA